MVGPVRGHAEVFRDDQSLGVVHYHFEVSGRDEVNGRIIHVDHVTDRASLAVPQSFLPQRAGLAADLLMRLEDGRLVGFCVPSTDGIIVNGRIQGEEAA